MKIFITSNDNQLIAAKVAKHSIMQRSNYQDDDIKIVHESNIALQNYFHSKPYLRGGRMIKSDINDMQSFTLLRFHIPELMKYKGKALVIDPDVFLVQRGLEDLEKFDFETYPIYARQGLQKDSWGSSVMLLSCEGLRHWSLKTFIDRLHKGDLDYNELMNLSIENSVGSLETKWNEFDVLKKDTMLLHTTERLTQPWRAGLKLNSSIKPFLKFIPKAPIYKFFGRDLTIGREHPDSNVTKFFFNELSLCISKNIIGVEEIKLGIKNKFIRNDIHEKINFFSRD